MVETRFCSFYMIATRIDSVYEDRGRDPNSDYHDSVPVPVPLLTPMLDGSTVAQVSLPYQVKRILNLFSVSVSFGLDGVSTPLECLGLRGYRQKLLTCMIAPISLALGIGIIAASARRALTGRLSWQEILEAALPSFLRIMFLACELRSGLTLARPPRILPPACTHA